MASGAGDWSAEQIDDYETLISTTDVELLKRAWRNEKASPEILPFEEALVKRAKEQIQLMEETVDDFAESGHDPLIASLYQMDLDRAQFLLRSYLRVRLQKIEKFMFHIWKMDTYRNRLSIEEEKFTERCIRDIGKHLEETVLSKLPDNYQSVLKQSIISEEDDMVPEPQLDTFVVAKCERATRPLYLDGSRQSASFDSSRNDHFQMVPGDLCILRYRPFQEELMSGNISLV
ncbi:DNA replication complex GINS protein SLD5 isoform X1 [Gossypium arboreum]|uniref:DNA replication complex GINS protein SLD5 isoform X1 n=1 Tax=Gossypium arboreum TaxID=29729 RepID=UPI0022F1C504|nr:DNA replication complex GINS protein SLD5 isoform X1 [Gossypium arboreum]